MGFIQKLFGSRNQRELAKLQPLVNRINELEKKFKPMEDSELKAMTAQFKERIEKGESLDDILPEAFAVTREASVRTTGMRHYDVQMVGGMVLHKGRIAEMRTGEGKTLVATLPTYLNALSGKGVHVVTVNDYLAKRDAEWMGRIHGFLGLRTGVVVHGIEDFERQAAYNADITYGQNNEFGFDYLRDNMKTSPDRMVQRGLNYAVVDEVDSILIDEARTPLIISGAGEASGDLYVKVDRLIPRLKREVDFTVDEKAHSAILTDEGVEAMEKLLGVENLFEASNIGLVHHVNQALRAHTLYKRNVNYLVEDSKVIIVDEHTGRKMPGRRWSDGLHQAIEAKEGVEVEEENQTLATVTFQNYFRMYKKLSGMTGTADTEASEFHEIYKLDVTVIPTNKPIMRKDFPDLVYKNEAGKFRAVTQDIEDCYKRGQPVLVGTVSVEKSEVVANVLRSKNVPFNVLNAKHHQREASIVAQAGRKGAITIATNMAGRGTDILLGGNPEAMAKDALLEEKEKLVSEASAAQQAEGSDGDAGDGSPYRGSSVPDFDEEKRLAELVEKFKKECEAERLEVLAAGGLKIVGTERHESRRIDNQLRGRAGRQGDPGSSRFYLSLQDDLLRIFGLDKMTGLMERLGLEEDVPIESPMVTRSIENAQKKVEGRNFDQRKNVLEYDDVMNQQRKTIYSLRRQILEGRYHPELSDEDKEKGLPEPEPVTVSGDWTQETIRPEVEKPLAEMIKVIKAKVKERDEAVARGEDNGDTRPGWRILRAEIWRQFGTLLDLERHYEKDSDTELLEYCAVEVAASLIQQRERLYDLSYTQLSSVIDKVLDPEMPEDEWNWDQLEDALNEAFATEIELTPSTPDEAAHHAWPDIEKQLTQREKDLSRAWLMYFLRHFYLEEIDQQWIEHLKTMDALREGIGLVGYGQKDPKKEYKKVGFTLFSEMMDRIQENVIKKVFNVQIKREEAAIPALQQKERQMIERGVADKSEDDDVLDAESGTEPTEKRSKARTAGDGPTTAPVKRERPKVGRNDPCPCGSGKKYKKCHGKDEEAAAEG
jgi:preprotein translocase subunit SecA